MLVETWQRSSLIVGVPGGETLLGGVLLDLGQ